MNRTVFVATALLLLLAPPIVEAGDKTGDKAGGKVDDKAATAAEIAALGKAREKLKDIELDWYEAIAWADTGEVWRFYQWRLTSRGGKTKVSLHPLEKKDLVSVTLPKKIKDPAWWKSTAQGLAGKKPVFYVHAGGRYTIYSPSTSAARPADYYAFIDSRAPANSCTPKPLIGSYDAYSVRAMHAHMKVCTVTRLKTKWGQSARVVAHPKYPRDGFLLLMHPRVPHLPAERFTFGKVTQTEIVNVVRKAKDPASLRADKLIQDHVEVLEWLEVEDFPVLPRVVRRRVYGSRSNLVYPMPVPRRDQYEIHVVTAVRKPTRHIPVNDVPDELKKLTVDLLDNRKKTHHRRHPNGFVEKIPTAWK